MFHTLELRFIFAVKSISQVKKTNLSFTSVIVQFCLVISFLAIASSQALQVSKYFILLFLINYNMIIHNNF